MTRVCLGADTIGYPEGGGHFWAYLNWALGFAALGCDVMWLEHVNERWTASEVEAKSRTVDQRLARYELENSLAICAVDGSEPVGGERWSPDAAWDADLFVNLRYSTDPRVVKRFRRSALIDIDPGLLQLWLANGEVDVAPYDTYFTTGEHVDAADPSRTWLPTSPCVAVTHWAVTQLERRAFTTVSQWWTEDWVQLGAETINNSKRAGFANFLGVAERAPWPIELALCLGDDALSRVEHDDLSARGWHIVNSEEVASTPWDYAEYILRSAGEFSCAKPSCIRLQNGWVSDRSLCYLAAGKPVIVQHTGPSARLPDRCGLLRFQDPDEAVACLQLVVDDYEFHSAQARELAMEFAAGTVAGELLERALA